MPFAAPYLIQLRQIRLSQMMRRSLTLLPCVLLGFTIAWAEGAVAQTPQVPQTPVETPAANSAPSELTQTLIQIDAAANQHDLAAVMRFYSPSFTHSDGLTYATFESTLSDLWKRYPNLTYKTTLNSWKQDGNTIIAETTTNITGTETSDGRPVNLSATITARQRFEAQQIVQQEILSETSQTASGDKPPTIEVNLPEEVKSGQPFDFDAIVAEPLGNRLLLGAAQEEVVDSNNYLQTSPIEFELLSAGGLFKQGRAPAIPGDRWVSGILIREDGITTVSQRIQIVPR